jgi:hypothetical protein
VTAYLSLPLAFLKFWYFTAPFALFGFFASVNHSFLQAFSLPLLLRTFFQPAKHEYRKGFIGFSIGMGMALKTPIIIVDMLLLSLLLAAELVVIMGFLLFPVATVLLVII